MRKKPYEKGYRRSRNRKGVVLSLGFKFIGLKKFIGAVKATYLRRLRVAVRRILEHPKAELQDPASQFRGNWREKFQSWFPINLCTKKLNFGGPHGGDPRMAPPKTILHEASDNSARFRVYWCGKNHEPPRLRV